MGYGISSTHAKWLCLTVMLLLLVSAANAQSAVSLGSVQQEKEIHVEPLHEYETKILFFNIYGDADLHINLRVDAVEGWNVSIEPGLHNASYNVTGGLLFIQENLLVKASSPVYTSGEEYATINGVSGYVPVGVARIKVKPLQDAKPANLSVHATAVLASQETAVGVGMERTFEYSLVPDGEKTNKTSAEIISAAVSNLPIEFGYVNPGVSGSPAEENKGFPLKVSVKPETNTDTALWLRATDLTYGSQKIGAENVEYSNSSDGEKIALRNDYRWSGYADWKTTAGSEKTMDVYLWITIPKGQPPGFYTNTLFVGVNAKDATPSSAPALPAVFVETTAPAATPVVTATTPTPSFEFSLAAVVLILLYLMRRRR